MKNNFIFIVSLLVFGLLIWFATVMAVEQCNNKDDKTTYLHYQSSGTIDVNFLNYQNYQQNYLFFVEII